MRCRQVYPKVAKVERNPRTTAYEKDSIHYRFIKDKVLQPPVGYDGQGNHRQPCRGV